MDESNIRSVVQHCIMNAGGYYYHPMDIPYKGAQERAKPDVFSLSIRPTVVIEVKKVFVRKTKHDTIDGLFEFKKIEDNQRMLLDSLLAIDVPVFMAIGSILKTEGKNDRMGSIVVIPWEEYLTWENSVDGISAHWSEILERWNSQKLDVKNEMFIEGTKAYLACKTDTKPFEWLTLSRRFDVREE